MNVNKQAKKDARLYAAAAMAIGEGAGNRRKLIAAQVDSKAARIPGYSQAFQRAMDAEDLGKHAKMAQRERRSIDAVKTVSKNAKGLATKDYRSVNGGVLIVAGLIYVAHQAGYDRKVIEKAKELKFKAKVWAKRKLDKDPEVHNITDLGK